MPDLLTSAEVERMRIECVVEDGEPHSTIIAACQALADSPCPVCIPGLPGRLPVGNTIPNEASRATFQFTTPCPHCGDFKPGRRGKAYERWQDACDSLS